MRIVNGLLIILFLPLLPVGYVAYLAWCSLVVGWTLAEDAGDKAAEKMRAWKVKP